MKLKDTGITCYSDSNLLQILKKRGYETVEDIIEHDQLFGQNEVVRSTGLQYLGLRELILYKYCDIKPDYSRYLDSKIIYKNEIMPYGIEEQDVLVTCPNYRRFSPIYSVFYRLGFNYYDADMISHTIKKIRHFTNVNNLTTLRDCFQIILKEEYLEENNWQLVAKEKIKLILESQTETKEEHKKLVKE